MPTFCRQTVWHPSIPEGISRYKVSIFTKREETKTYLGGLGVTLGFLLLIRVSQVRALYGLPAKSPEFANEPFTTIKGYDYITKKAKRLPFQTCVDELLV